MEHKGAHRVTLTDYSRDQLRVRTYPTRVHMGQAAAADVALALREDLHTKDNVRIVFAAAPSQNDMLDSLATAPDIDWSRVTALHMDEYVGLAPDAPERFGAFLTKRLFDKVRPGRVELIDGAGEHEARRYAEVLAEQPVDLVCLGIGENGHIAFNDPEVADFTDPVSVKVVALDERSRVQQVNDGCFAMISAVPTHAITLTIPALTSGRRLFCVVPGATKRDAVRAALDGPITEACPASVLRRHPDCTLYLDADSAP